MSIVKRLRATTPEELEEVAGCVHDAYFEHEQVVFDEAACTVTVPFVQEGGEWLELPHASLPEPEVLRKTWRYKEYRVPFLRCEVVVHSARSVHLGPKDTFPDPGMLDYIEYDSAGAQVLIRAVTGPEISVQVDSLQLEMVITDAVALNVRRRRGWVGVSDTPYASDQPR
jgi:hypothetical protein